MSKSFTHRIIRDGWVLSKYVGCKKTYYLTAPMAIDIPSIKDYLKTLPGHGMIIIEKVYNANEIWFTCTLPIKEVVKKMCEMLGVEKPQKYGHGGGRKEKIYKCDANGNIIKVYNSGIEAAKENNLSSSSITKSVKTGKLFNGYRYCK